MSFSLPNLRSYWLLGALLLAIVRRTTDALTALQAKQSLTSNVTLDLILILLIVGAIMDELSGNAIACPAIPIALFAGLAAALLLLPLWRSGASGIDRAPQVLTKGDGIMIEWTPIAVNENPLLRGKNILPEYSAAVIGSSVVLRFYDGGLTALSVALTTIPFAAASEAAAWIEANRIALATTSELDPQ